LISNSGNIFEYLLLVEELLAQESERCQQFLHPQTLQKVRQICINALVLSHSEVIFKELVSAMNDLVCSVMPTELEISNLQFSTFVSHLEPLKSVFQLFVTVQYTASSPQFLRNLGIEFSRFGILLGENLRSRFRVPGTPQSSRLERRFIKAYVQGVVTVLMFLTDMCVNLFLEDPLFVQAIKKASKAIVNTDIDSLQVLEIYAAYCDCCVQVSSPASSELTFRCFREKMTILVSLLWRHS
jgi:hypothetical protein